MYSLTGNRNFARKEELIYETIATLNYLQCWPSLVTAHAQFPITKQVIVFIFDHFHIPLIFCSLLSQPRSIRYFFSLFDTFSDFRN